MTLQNITRKTTVTPNLKEVKYFSDKLLGLLKKENHSLLFRTRFGIHSFFLKEPIDVLVLDSKNKVAKARSLKPNNIFFYNPKYPVVIELPGGTIKKSKTEIGDQLLPK